LLISTHCVDNQPEVGFNNYPNCINYLEIEHEAPLEHLLSPSCGPAGYTYLHKGDEISIEISFTGKMSIATYI
jgi:hypothetical protein